MKGHIEFIRDLNRRIQLLEHVLRLTRDRKDRRKIKLQIRELRRQCYTADGDRVSVLKAGAL